MNAYHWSPINRREANLLRALAILAIVFHNYLHWISDSPGENEFTYRPERIQSLLDGLLNEPWDAFRLLATYFGHYGVQIFFFLSGYGLTRKYRGNPPAWWSFQKHRWSRLYPAIFTAALGYLLYEGCRLGWSTVIQAEGANLLRQMLGISNFIPDNIYHPIGPWWFIGVVLQFYLLAPWILRQVEKHGLPLLYGLIALSLGSEWLAGPWLSSRFDFNINHSILGHLDLCALGIMLARKNSFTIHPSVIPIAALLFLAGNFNSTLWVTTGLSLALFVLPLLRLLLKKMRPGSLGERQLLTIGQLSMYIFLCNGYLRKPLIEWAQQSPHWWTSIWTSFVFLAICILWAAGLRQLTQQIKKPWGRTSPQA